MKRILLAAVAAIAVAGTANAADIAAPPPAIKAPAYVPPPIFSWAGFYIGANLGYGWTDGSGTLTPVGIPITGDGDGFFGGFQAGYNWQFGNFVYGIETDFQLSAGDGTVRSPVIGAFGDLENEWFGTIRGRLGYAVNRWLFYVTGGGAYVHNTLTPRPGFAFPAASETGWTWTVGGGIEAALWQNWSVKAEYLYIGTPSDVPAPAPFGVDGDTDTHTIRVGVNYHF